MSAPSLGVFENMVLRTPSLRASHFLLIFLACISFSSSLSSSSLSSSSSTSYLYGAVAFVFADVVLVEQRLHVRVLPDHGQDGFVLRRELSQHGASVQRPLDWSSAESLRPCIVRAVRGFPEGARSRVSRGPAPSEPGRNGRCTGRAHVSVVSRQPSRSSFSLRRALRPRALRCTFPARTVRSPLCASERREGRPALRRRTRHRRDADAPLRARLAGSRRFAFDAGGLS